MSGTVRLPVAGLAACLVFGTACSKPDAKPAGNADSTAVSTTTSPGAKPLIAMVRAADWMGSEWSEDAIKLGLRESDMEPDRDYELNLSSAQGDLATLPNLIDAAVDAKAKVIVALQDATLQVAVQRVKSIPIVFHLLADPFAAGAGKSDSNHLPNITGVYSPGFGDPEQTTSGVTLQLGTTTSGVNDLVTARLAGASAGANDVDGGVTSIQSPPITLPKTYPASAA